jgi:hypothetical protein
LPKTTLDGQGVLLHERARGRLDAEEPRYAELRARLLASSLLASETRDFLKIHRSLQTPHERRLRTLQFDQPGIVLR